MITSEQLRNKAELAPGGPGVYIYRDGRGRPLYVGKAKSLRQRVRSYFHTTEHPPKTAQMLSEAIDLEYILTGSEVEALILENNFIKKERPRYNILLRDDKNYPYLKLTVEDEFPRVTLVRRARRDGGEYFGPYLPASSARRTLRMVAKYFQVAICHERLDGSRPRPCLYYQLHQCLGPCAGLVTRERYRQAVDDVRLFLQGRDHDLVRSLGERMRRASSAQEYEQAAHYRDLMRTLERSSRKQTLASVGLEQQDYFHYHREGAQAVLELFMMREGLIQSRREFAFENAEGDEFLGAALAQYYTGETFVPGEIYVPHEFNERELLGRWLSERRGGRVDIKMPRRGVKARFLDTVLQNADFAFENRFRAAHTHGVQGLEELREALGLDEAPYRIEAFDISNLQGTDQVASMVVWEGGRPKPSEYRKFRIRTVAGSDDFRCLAEAVQRRYARRLESGGALPDLVLIDGGKGQLGAASAVLRDIGLHELQVAAIAKREEVLYLEGRQAEIRLPDDSPALHLLQRVRDEAHRFAVRYHRTLRRKRTVRSQLEEVPGLGPRRVRRLLERFGSLDGVLSASEAELETALGARLAQELLRWRRARGAARPAQAREARPAATTASQPRRSTHG
ncbi:MAG: excinuclease ABC subunit UvrC [Acidobacteriota bacterium]